MTTPLDIPSPRSCNYYNFFSEKTTYETYQEKGLFQSAKVLTWNLSVGIPQFIFNRFIDLGSLACWMTQLLPLSLVFTSSVNQLEKVAHEIDDKEMKTRREALGYKEVVGLLENKVKKMELFIKCNQLEDSLECFEKECFEKTKNELDQNNLKNQTLLISAFLSNPYLHLSPIRLQGFTTQPKSDSSK